MGDRVRVVFFNKYTVSPLVYLHWEGSRVTEHLERLKDRMKGRYNDPDYAAARFAGICHEAITGNTGMGIESNNLMVDDLTNVESLKQYSPGDAGLVVVDTSDFTWKAYHGYLARQGEDES